MYPKDFPDLVYEQYNRTYPDNSCDALKKFRPALAGGKKYGVKPGLNIKADKTHEIWYSDFEAYQKLSSHDIKMKRISFLNSSHYDACFNVTRIEEQYFGRFLIKVDNGKLEASAVMWGHRRKYTEIENKLIQYLDLCAHKYSQSKCGVRWIFIENKWLKFAEGSGLNDFKAPLIWISATLKCNKKFGINFPGEANDMTYKEKGIIM